MEEDYWKFLLQLFVETEHSRDYGCEHFYHFIQMFDKKKVLKKIIDKKCLHLIRSAFRGDAAILPLSFSCMQK